MPLNPTHWSFNLDPKWSAPKPDKTEREETTWAFTIRDREWQLSAVFIQKPHINKKCRPKLQLLCTAASMYYYLCLACHHKSVDMQATHQATHECYWLNDNRTQYKEHCHKVNINTD